MTLDKLQKDFNVSNIPLEGNMTLMDGLNYKENVNDRLSSFEKIFSYSIKDLDDITNGKKLLKLSLNIPYSRNLKSIPPDANSEILETYIVLGINEEEKSNRYESVYVLVHKAYREFLRIYSSEPPIFVVHDSCIKNITNNGVKKIAGDDYIALNKKVVNFIRYFKVLSIDTEEILCQKK